MLRSLAGFFTRNNFSHEKVVKKEPKVTNFVCRDDLNKKPATNKPKKDKKVSFASDEKPKLAAGENNGAKNLEGLRRKRRNHASSSISSAEEKGVIRVKVRMTKAEAARLLAKCQDGGVVLGFKDVANELTQIPINRVHVAFPVATRASVLNSIPEEF